GRRAHSHTDARLHRAELAPSATRGTRLAEDEEREACRGWLPARGGPRRRLGAWRLRASTSPARRILAADCTARDPPGEDRRAKHFRGDPRWRVRTFCLRGSRQDGLTRSSLRGSGDPRSPRVRIPRVVALANDLSDEDAW